MAIYSDRTCRECGKAFEGGPRAWYCPACRMERQRMQSREHKRNGAVRKLGSEDTCTVCGAKYIVQSGKQQYCPTCAPVAVAEIDRKQAMEYYVGNRETINPTRQERRRATIRTCRECGTEYAQNGSNAVTCSKACKEVRLRRQMQEGEQRRAEKKKAGQ